MHATRPDRVLLTKVAEVVSVKNPLLPPVVRCDGPHLDSLFP